MNKKILITGGTVFVSRRLAEYFAGLGAEVYVLNRNSRAQLKGVRLICADRHKPGDILRGYEFDAVIDTGYNAEDVRLLLDGLGGFGDYILISSSAVYPENAAQPFTEETQVGENKIWGKYGTDKIGAEAALMRRFPGGYIIRPPYLYGQMNNVYREAFVFDCAVNDRAFYLPGDGEMKLQFFHIDDLCRLAEIILENKPLQHIFNAGNRETVSVREWVEMCYGIAGKKPRFINVYEDIPQRNYFCFYDYEYYLEVSRQYELMGDVKPLERGLAEAFEWYESNSDKVVKKPLIEYIDKNLTGLLRL